MRAGSPRSKGALIWTAGFQPALDAEHRPDMPAVSGAQACVFCSRLAVHPAIAQQYRKQQRLARSLFVFLGAA